MHLCTFMISCRIRLRMRLFQKKVSDRIKTRFSFNNFFSPEKLAVYDNVEKCGRAGKATDDGAYPRIGHEGTEGE